MKWNRRLKMTLGGALAAVVFLVVGLQFPLVVVFSFPLIGGSRISEGYRGYRGKQPGGVENMVLGVVLVSVAYLIGAMDVLQWNTEVGVLAIL
ncbi:hypothetical protein IIA16_03360 [bacterium]|nr:hypothetical protein [bacterium]